MRPPIRPVFVAASGGALVATARAWCFRAMLGTLPVTHGPAQVERREEERPAMVEAEPTPQIEEKVERRVVAKRQRLGGDGGPGLELGPPPGFLSGWPDAGGRGFGSRSR
jgi:hypothetical protein